MQTVKIDVKDYTTTGGVHANLILNGTDTGVLYLSNAEKELLLSLLIDGARESELDVRVECNEPDDEIDIDIFE
jgi:hypothetical protein